MASTLERLTPGMIVPFGGDQAAIVDQALAAAFRPGDRLIVVQETGALLHVPAAVAACARAAVDQAEAAFQILKGIDDETISGFFAGFAGRLADPAIWSAIAAANAADVARARTAGRQVGRLALRPASQAEMIAGLDAWRDMAGGRGRTVEAHDHPGWRVEIETAALGVVGFVFEGRPNVLVDACGVIRGGNAAVFRVGSDALETARTIADLALKPALAAAGLPAGAAVLLDAPERAAGWALFADPRLALAVARGSGPAVTELGAVARQSGVEASLHGTGGAWLIAEASADPARFTAALAASLDRKVCNTCNVCAIVGARLVDLAPLMAMTLERLGARLHLSAETRAGLPADALEALAAGRVIVHDRADLGHEWEWEEIPELWLAAPADLDDAIALFNARSPRFIASLIAEDQAAQDRFHLAVEAAFVGDGFTRWVDGQYALGRPELGLSTWSGGRPLARGGILSGDGVHSLRTRMRQGDSGLRR
jgi:glutamate-5-semialdehyde dehydrogenase